MISLLYAEIILHSSAGFTPYNNNMQEIYPQNFGLTGKIISSLTRILLLRFLGLGLGFALMWVISTLESLPLRAPVPSMYVSLCRPYRYVSSYRLYVPSYIPSLYVPSYRLYTCLRTVSIRAFGPSLYVLSYGRYTCPQTVLVRVFIRSLYVPSYDCCCIYLAVTPEEHSKWMDWGSS